MNEEMWTLSELFLFTSMSVPTWFVLIGVLQHKRRGTSWKSTGVCYAYRHTVDNTNNYVIFAQWPLKIYCLTVVAESKTQFLLWKVWWLSVAFLFSELVLLCGLQPKTFRSFCFFTCAVHICVMWAFTSTVRWLIVTLSNNSTHAKYEKASLKSFIAPHCVSLGNYIHWIMS